MFRHTMPASERMTTDRDLLRDAAARLVQKQAADGFAGPSYTEWNVTARATTAPVTMTLPW